MMVKKVPIGTGNVLYVRSHRDEFAIRLQRAKSLVQRPLQRGLRRQVFEEIAREYNVQGGVLHSPLGRTVLRQNCHARICILPGIGIQIHSKLQPAHRRIDEFAPAATQVKHCGIRRDPLRKEVRQNSPHFLAISRSFREAGPIYLLEIFRGVLRIHRQPSIPIRPSCHSWGCVFGIVVAMTYGLQKVFD